MTRDVTENAHTAADMVGDLVAKVATPCRAELGGLRAGGNTVVPLSPFGVARGLDRRRPGAPCRRIARDLRTCRRNRRRTLRGGDAMLRGVSTQWTLVAQIDDGTPALTIEAVRNLPGG